jgi:hypothetical protein
MTTRNRSDVRVATIRQLGGEIWSEISQRIPEAHADWRAKGKFVDVVMGVLARHAGEFLENDADLPVDPLGEFEEGI